MPSCTEAPSCSLSLSDWETQRTFDEVSPHEFTKLHTRIHAHTHARTHAVPYNRLPQITELHPCTFRALQCTFCFIFMESSHSLITTLNPVWLWKWVQSILRRWVGGCLSLAGNWVMWLRSMFSWLGKESASKQALMSLLRRNVLPVSLCAPI